MIKVAQSVPERLESVGELKEDGKFRLALMVAYYQQLADDQSKVCCFTSSPVGMCMAYFCAEMKDQTCKETLYWQQSIRQQAVVLLAGWWVASMHCACIITFFSILLFCTSK